MTSGSRSAIIAASAAASLALLVIIGLASCGGETETTDDVQPSAELEAELQQDVSLMVLRPEDFGPTHRCDPATSPGLAPAELLDWCIRTPPAQAEGDEACVLSGAFLFPKIADAKQFFADVEMSQRPDQARKDGQEIRPGQDPELGDAAVLHTVSSTSADFCGLAGAPANAIWISIRQGKAVLRFELWALGKTASVDEALDLAAKQLKRAEAVPTLQPSQMLLQEGDLPPGSTLGDSIPVGLWGRAITFSNEGEGLVIGSLALPFRTADEARATLQTMQLTQLPAMTLGDAAPAPIESEDELAPPAAVGDTARALRARAASGQEVYVIALCRGPGLAAVVSLAEPGWLSPEQVAELAARMDVRIQDALE